MSFSKDLELNWWQYIIYI